MFLIYDLYMYIIPFLVFTFAQQNRDEGMWSNSAVDGVKWKDQMSTIILNRLEASFDNWDDKLPHATGKMIQNTETDCNGRPQCTIIEGESSRMEYFDSACYDDDTGFMHTPTEHDSIV